MQKRYFLCLCVLFLFVTESVIDAVSQSDSLNKPVPNSVRHTFKLANELAEQENFAESAAAQKKTIVAAPQLVRAHVNTLMTGIIIEELMKDDPAQ